MDGDDHTASLLTMGAGCIHSEYTWHNDLEESKVVIEQRFDKNGYNKMAGGRIQVHAGLGPNIFIYYRLMFVTNISSRH